jgi:membrane protease YdiL (CAAX protease family)
MIATAIAFKQMYHFNPWNPKVSELYKKPKRLAQALGTFPAMYGFGYGIAMLTLLAGYLITRATGGGLIEDMLRPTTVGPTTTLSGALIMVFLLVIVAPIFEEIWVRGIMYDALKPYGDGIAILITSIIFGLMHGSINMLFYTTALGFALGYVRYATNSLLIVIILHAIINAIAAGLLFIMTMVELTHEANRLINTVQNIYMLAMLVLIIVGIIAFILKIPTIRKYKIENNWPQVSSGKKTAVFFLSIPVILMLILAINEHTHFWLISLILP